MCVCVCLSLSLFLAFSFFLSCILPACLRSGVRVSPDTFVLLRVCVGCAAVAALPGLQSLQLSHLFELTDDNMAYVCQSCRQLKHLAVKVRARLAVSTDGWTHAHTHTNAHTHAHTHTHRHTHICTHTHAHITTVSSSTLFMPELCATDC